MPGFNYKPTNISEARGWTTEAQVILENFTDLMDGDLSVMAQGMLAELKSALTKIEENL